MLSVLVRSWVLWVTRASSPSRSITAVDIGSLLGLGDGLILRRFGSCCWRSKTWSASGLTLSPRLTAVVRGFLALVWGVATLFFSFNVFVPASGRAQD